MQQAAAVAAFPISRCAMTMDEIDKLIKLAQISLHSFDSATGMQWKGKAGGTASLPLFWMSGRVPSLFLC